jgi:hypothetical protein
MEDYEREDFYFDEEPEIDTLEKSIYVPIVNEFDDKNNLENEEFESYTFNVDKSEKSYLQYNVNEFILFIKNILQDCPLLVESYIDEYDNFNEDYKQYPIWFLIFINPEFNEKEMKILVQNCKFIEPFTCFNILSQLENSDEDPYYYINLYIKVWNAFDLYNSPIKSQIIDHIQKNYFTNKDKEYDYPCMVEFIKIILSLDAGKKPRPEYIIPYENNEDIFLNFEKQPYPEIPTDILDQLSVCDEAQLENIDINCQFINTITEIEFIKLFGPINKCNFPTKDENYGGGCRMLTCNCFEYDEFDNPSEYFYDQTCRICNIEISDKRDVIRAPLVNGGWIGCYCCYNCANIGIDQFYYSDLEKKIMKKLLLFNYRLIQKYKIYDTIPDIIFNE